MVLWLSEISQLHDYIIIDDIKDEDIIDRREYNKTECLILGFSFKIA